MKRIQGWVRNYFGFSSTETNGFLILLPLMVVLLFSGPAYQWWLINYNSPAIDSGELDSVVATWKWDSVRLHKPKPKTVNHALFSFDPNKSSSHELTQLGISPKVVQHILRFREKGGRFKTPSDLMKIYGMDSVLARQLQAFITLPEKPMKAPPSFKKEKATAPLRAKKFADPFDLNQADTTVLMSIYGVGPKLSTRIVSYRNRLGGFVSMNQLTEVFGLDSAVIQQLKEKSYIAQNFQPKQIDLNTAGKKELSSIPYIRFALANAITAWRFQHGPFKSVDELKQIVLMDDVIFQKIKPYLTVKE